jgi:SSS family solute:Na+ symporter
MNASATVFLEDIYARYFHRQVTGKQKMRVLYAGTIVFGLAGMLSGLAMMGTASILDMWWELSGIFAAGMLGIFLLGIFSRATGNHAAMIAAVIGILVIAWMTFSPRLPANLGMLKNPFDKNMVIVIGTLSIFLVGVLLSRRRRR